MKIDCQIEWLEISDTKLHSKLEALRQEDSKAALIKQSSIEEYEKKIESDKEQRMSHAVEVADRKLQNILQARRDQEDDKYVSTREKVEARTALIQQSQAELQQQPTVKTSAYLTKSSSLDSETKTGPGSGGLQVKSILKKRNSEDNRATLQKQGPVADTQPVISTVAPAQPKTTKAPDSSKSTVTPKTSLQRSKTMGETTVTPIVTDQKGGSSATPKRMSAVLKRAKTFDATVQDADPNITSFFKAKQEQPQPQPATAVTKAEPAPTIEVSAAEVML